MSRSVDAVVVAAVLASVPVAWASDCVGFLEARASYGVGSTPGWVELADVDNDGDLDAVTMNFNSDSVSVLINCGFGLFEQAAAYPVGPLCQGLALGDINGDGFNDVVVVSADTFQDVVVLTNNGDGTFAAASTIGVLDDLAALDLADVDNDGDTDLVAANRGGTVDVYRNSGVALFGGQTNINVGGQPEDVVFVDVNNDNRQDIVCIDAANNTVILRVQSLAGGFSQSVTLGVGNTPTRLHAADLDGDGNRDLVVSQFGAGEVSVFFNEGGLVFAAEQVIGVADGPAGISTGDFDGDGQTDVAIANQTSAQVAVLTNQGSRTFVASYIDAGALPTGLAAGDVTGDGLAELAFGDIGDGRVGVLYNRGGDLDEVIPGHTPWRSDAADLDNDGDIDVVSSSGTSSLRVYENVGGVLADPILQDVSERSWDVRVADFDGDGNQDVVSVHNVDPPTIRVLLGNGDLTFQTPQTLTWGSSNGHFATIADIDGDNDLDIVATCLGAFGGFNTQFFLNDGSGVFSVGSGIAGTSVWGIDSADFDNDGDPDLAIARPGFGFVSGGVDVYLNDGSGVFTLSNSYDVGSSANGLRHVAVADLNDDGVIDLVGSKGTDTRLGAMYVWFGVGDGTFGARIEIPASNNPRDVVTGDFNGDKINDIAVALVNTDAVGVYVSDGLGGFALMDEYGVGANPLAVLAADLNLDGSLDLVSSNAQEVNNAGVGAALSVLYNGCPGCPADLDNSGTIDLADLLSVLAVFGQPTLGPEDINGSGVVDLQDLLIVLALFGQPCP